MKHFVFLFTIFLTSCSLLGSKTIYKSKQTLNLKHSGVAELYYQNELNAIFPNSDKIFITSLQNVYQLKTGDSLKFINEKISFINPDTSKIKSICSSNGLEGVFISNLKLIRVRQVFLFIPLGKYIDTEVDLKYYDKTGILIIHTRHKTSTGNSYLTNPTTEKTISDGTKGAIKKIFREYHL